MRVFWIVKYRLLIAIIVIGILRVSFCPKWGNLFITPPIEYDLPPLKLRGGRGGVMDSGSRVGPAGIREIFEMTECRGLK